MFFIDALYQVEEIPFISSLLNGLIMKVVGICYLLYLNLLRWSCDFFPPLFYWHNVLQWFSYVEPTLHFWGKSHLVMMYNIFYILLESVCCLLLLQGFGFVFIKGFFGGFIFIEVSFLVMTLFCFYAMVILVLEKGLESVLFSSIFGNSLVKNFYELFFKCLVEFTSKAIWIWAFLYGKF